MRSLVLFSLVLVSCAQSPKVTKKEVRLTTSDLNSCLAYKKNVLDAAYTLKKNGSVEFTRDADLARTFLNQFDSSQSLSQVRAQMVQNILNDCRDDNVAAFNAEFYRANSCEVLFSELNFFQGLAFGLQKYYWPTDLKFEGKKVALDYVRYYSEGDFPLLNRLVALSVLDELSVNQVVNPKLHVEIKEIMSSAQQYVEGLKQKVNPGPTLSCASFDVIREELAYSKKVGSKVQELLKKI